MRRLAVLLRAVNVGGTGKLAMSALKEELARRGYSEPRTLGAAGSVVLGSEAPPERLERELAGLLSARFGLATEVFARTRAELEDAIAGNPFERMARDTPGGLILLFLNGEPQPADVAALRARIPGPEEIAAGPRLLYIAYGAGIGRSKLTPGLLERTLKLRGTGRNFNTVSKLAELTA